MMNRISENTDKYIQTHPELDYINATNTNYAQNLPLNNSSYYNYIGFLVETTTTLETEIKKLINKEFSNNTNEDLCRMKDLVIVIDKDLSANHNKEKNEALARYIPHNNIIIIYLKNILKEDTTYDINTPNSIPKQTFKKMGEILTHELNHVRQYACEERQQKGQVNTTISYDNSIVTTLTESSAESALYDETGTICYDMSYKDDNGTYYSERKFETKLLLMSLTDNSTTIDDYYASIFNTDLMSLVHYFNLNSKKDIQSFFNILKQYDTLELRNPVLATTTHKKSLSSAEARSITGCNYNIEILRLSLKNLIDYNLTNPECLTIEELLTLEKLIVYQLCDSAHVYQLNEQQELELDQNGELITTYEESFVNQLIELEEKFNKYLKEYYQINEEELNTQTKIAVQNIEALDLYLSEKQNPIYANETIIHLSVVFPKLKTIVSRIMTLTNDSYTKVLKSTQNNF